jgi:hypothetical protein
MLPLGDMGPVNPMATLLIAFGLKSRTEKEAE